MDCFIAPRQARGPEPVERAALPSKAGRPRKDNDGRSVTFSHSLSRAATHNAGSTSARCLYCVSVVNTDAILSQRLNNQRLVNSTCREPEAIVSHLGAMQAQ